MATESRTLRIASTAAWSAPILSPRPTIRAAASAAASVVRTSSRARLRSGPDVWGMPGSLWIAGGGCRGALRDALGDVHEHRDRPRPLRGEPQMQPVALPRELVHGAQRRLGLHQRGLA